MANKLNKKVGQFMQWTAEKAGKASKSEVDEEFKLLETATEHKLENLDKVATDTRGLLQLAAPVMPTNSSLLIGERGPVRPKKAEGVKPKNAFEQLGLSMVEAGSDLPEESNFGAAMVKCGEAMGAVGDALLAWEAGVRDQYLQPIARVLDDETKEYQHQKKKLENRRLDYDAKRTNLQKSKKDDKTELENEVNSAKAKFEETVGNLRDIMLKIAANEAEELSNLEAFVAQNRRFFETGAKVFAELSRTLTDPNVRGVRLVKTDTSVDSSGNEINDANASPAIPEETPSSRPVSTAATASPTVATAPVLAPPVAKKPVALPTPATGVPTGNLISLPTPAPALPQATTAPKPASAPAPAPAPAPAVSTAPPPRPKPRAAPAAHDRVRALYTFTPDNDDELPFAKGDIIQIVTKVDDSWYVGELNGKRGLFPSNYVGPL